MRRLNLTILLFSLELMVALGFIAPLALASCIGGSGSETPTSLASPTLMGTSAASATPLNTGVATFTPTVTATQPAPTIWDATETPAQEFRTPTPVFQPGMTPSPILEVTAIGGRPYVEGFYTPNRTLKVRVCAKADDAECPSTRLWYAGSRARIFDMFVNKETGETWLTPDPAGNTWVAFLIGEDMFGLWEPDQ